MSSRKSMSRTSLNAGTSTFVVDEPRAAAVDFSDEALVVRLTDGRSLSVPLAWLPRLDHASNEDRGAYQRVDGGEEIRWPSLDEDLSVRGLLGLPD